MGRQSLAHFGRRRKAQTMNEIKEIKERFEAKTQDLARMRDELRLQLHLASAETKSEWEKLEKKWQELERKYAPVKSAAVESSHDIREALELLLEELKNGYKRVLKSIP